MHQSKSFLIIWLIFILEILYPYLLYFTGKSELPFGTTYVILLLIPTLFGILIKGYKDFNITDFFFLVILLWAIASYILSANQQLALLGIKNNFRMIFIYFFVRITKPTEKSIKTLLDFTLVLAIIAAIYGIYQYFFNYLGLIDKFGKIAEDNLSYFGLAEESKWNIKRAYSFFLNWSTFAYYLMISIFYFFSSRLIQFENKGKFRFKDILLMLILLIATVLTFSRTVWVGLLIGSIFMLFIYKKSILKFRLLIVGLSLAISFILFINLLPKELGDEIIRRFTSVFSSDSASTSGHYDFIIQNINLLLIYPFGLGLGTTSAIHGILWTESSIFKIIIEIGIVPGVLFIFFFLRTINYSYTIYKNENRMFRKIASLTTFGLSIAYFLGGIVFPLWFAWFPTIILWTLMASIINWKLEEKQIVNRKA